MTGLRHRRGAFALAMIVGLVVVLAFVADSTTVRFATRIAIFAIAALAVDFVLGYAGLVSFGHAAFLGLGAYVTGILSLAGYTDAAIVWPAAVAVSSLAALVIGALALRTSGIYFIMITLAFSQMLFFGANALPKLGGGDGFRLPGRNTLMGVDIGNPRIFFVVCCVSLGVILFGIFRARDSVFGNLVRAARDDEVRAAASGIEAYGLRLCTFIISGAIAGLAGALLANHTLYIAPSSTFSWYISAELLVMIIIGGAGTLWGPVVGTAVLLIIVEVISHYTDYWSFFVGLLVVVRVVLIPGGFVELAKKITAVRS
jgi:branched-chain amino acid transport system permease protein